MRGYPLLQLLLVGCLFVAAGFPVWKLTRQESESASPTTGISPPPEPPKTSETALEVRVSFAPAPAEFRLTYLGQLVLGGRGPQAEFQARTSVTLPKEGVDFALEAHWPAGAANADATTLAAARVIFIFPDGHQAEHSVWSDSGGSLVELVTVTP